MSRVQLVPGALLRLLGTMLGAGPGVGDAGAAAAADGIVGFPSEVRV
jgi:hypothetical protein